MAFKNIEIYGFSGKMGSGKNFVSEQIFLPMLPPKRTVVLALADHFKVDACSKDGLAYHRVFVDKDSETRKILQYRGTEEGRAKYGEDIWTRTLETWMQVHVERGIERFIITDVRFKNEVKWVQQLGGQVFRIISPNRTQARMEKEATIDGALHLHILGSIKNHASETDLDSLSLEQFDTVFYNDYQDENTIYNTVRNVVLTLCSSNSRSVIFCDLDDTLCKCHVFYNEIIAKVMKHFEIADKDSKPLLDKYVNNFAEKYYQKDAFAQSLILVVNEYLRGYDLDLSECDREFIYRQGMSVYDYTYDWLSPDVPETLRKLEAYGQIVIFTLGDRLEQMKKIVQLGLTKYPIEIFPHKDANMFRYLKNKYPADCHIMIGDSFKRDIMPALEADISNMIHISSTSCDPLPPVYTTQRFDQNVLDYIQELTK